MGLKLINFRGEDEIAFGQAVDLVGPNLDFNFSPGEKNVGVVALLLRQLTDAVHKIECLAKVGKFESFREMVLVRDGPPLHLLLEDCERFTFERRYAASTGDTVLLRQL